MTDIPPRWSSTASRGIVARIVATSALRFDEAVHLGSGEPASLVDETVLRDAATGCPLLPGTTLAGALRALLLRVSDDRGLVDTLFGTVRGDGLPSESLLVVDDAVAETGTVEIREGVRLDGSTRTAHDGALYDAEAWAAHTAFPLRLELVLTRHHDADRLASAFASLLDTLRDEGLALGARKHRGFGLARVDPWRVRRFDLTSTDGLLDWLADPDPRDENRTLAATAALGVDPLPDCRCLADLEATFVLPGALLIRAGVGEDDRGPDAVHLHALRTESDTRDPVVPGTSWAGALRAQATRILRTLGTDDDARAHVDDLFGPDLHSDSADRPAPRGSRLHTRTSIVESATANLVQHRVSIDRFTGGAYPGALFNEQPLFGNGQAALTLRLRIERPSDADVGLLVLLLRDLWTGILPLGGQRSVGRGRLTGRTARLILRDRDASRTVHLAAGDDGTVEVADADRNLLDHCVDALRPAAAAHA